MAAADPLSADHIQPLLEQWLEVEFTFYRVETLATDIARRPRDEQDFLLNWTRRIASTNIEIAYQFARRAGELLSRMDRHLIESWALHAMDAYDREGLRPGLLVIEQVGNFAQLYHEHTAGVVFEDVDGILLTFVRGLSGRRLNIKEGDAIYTDSETLFLPPVIARMESAEDNFTLAKALVALMWAQTRFGTFRVDLDAALAGYENHALALRTLATLEALRLEGCIARELPGLHREMQRLKSQLGQDRMPTRWAGVAPRLAAMNATIEDSLAALVEVYAPGEAVELCFQGELRPQAVAACLAARVEREKMLLRVKLAELAKEGERAAAVAEAPQPAESPAPARFELTEKTDADSERNAFELTLDGAPIAPPEAVRDLLTSIKLDLGQIPDEYLVAAGPGEYNPELFADTAPDADDVWKGTYHEEGAKLYREWDHGRQAYRKNWCAVREKDVAPVYDDFVSVTLTKHTGIAGQLKRSFEAMRDENRLLKRQPHGDSVDLDALVEAIADTHDGREMTERLFTRMHRAERNIAVAFMVDMSGSTKGWINDAEREALVLLCEALESLGDRYAIYGFSGTTRKRCEIYRIKRFEEPYGEEVRARISGIRPQDYTRMGFAIRHLTDVLDEVEARTKLLITISDGKPDDYHDRYRGQYGIEDTRQALVEAKRRGIRSFCITIDKEGHEYLPHMYGAAHYVIVDNVRTLPFKVADLYRRLTS